MYLTANKSGKYTGFPPDLGKLEKNEIAWNRAKLENCVNQIFEILQFISTLYKKCQNKLANLWIMNCLFPTAKV